MRDGELFERMASGDISALDELIGAYYPEILRFCLRHTPTRECAEDAAQETFLNCVRHMDAYSHRGHFRAWLYKIASNACADVLRRARPAEELRNRIRGLNPWPAAYTGWNGAVLKIFSAAVVDACGAPGTVLAADRGGLVVACGDKALKIETLQAPGGRVMSSAQFLAGHPVAVGSRLTAPAGE